MKPEHLENHLARLFDVDKFNEILSLTNTHRDLISDSERGLRILALTYFKLKRYPESAKTLAILLGNDPYNEELVYNLGVIYQTSGDYKLGAEKFLQSTKLNKKRKESYINLAYCLKECANNEAAICAIRAGLDYFPNDPDLLWNSQAFCQDINSAIEILSSIQTDELALYEKVKVMLAGLLYYKGKPEKFKDILRDPILKDHAFTRSFKWSTDATTNHKIFFNRKQIFDFCFSLTNTHRAYYEFGVWKGYSFNYIAPRFKSAYGFDTFCGLPEDWHDIKKGSYNANDSIPQVKHGSLIKGKFEDTLEAFFNNLSLPKAGIVNFDADLYSSTKIALTHVAPLLDEHSVLIFDEYIMNKSWENDEHKAFLEFLKLRGLTAELVAVSFFTKQAVFRLIGVRH